MPVAPGQHVRRLYRLFLRGQFPGATNSTKIAQKLRGRESEPIVKSQVSRVPQRTRSPFCRRDLVSRTERRSRDTRSKAAFPGDETNTWTLSAALPVSVGRREQCG